MFRRILVPSDGSDHALKAVRLAAELAKESAADVVLITVISLPHALVMLAGIGDQIIDEYIERSGREALGPALEVLAAEGVGAEVKIQAGVAAEEIIREARETGVDLVVMGKRGLGEIKGLLLGSVSDRVAHHSGVPVLLVP